MLLPNRRNDFTFHPTLGNFLTSPISRDAESGDTSFLNEDAHHVEVIGEVALLDWRQRILHPLISRDGAKSMTPGFEANHVVASASQILDQRSLNVVENRRAGLKLTEPVSGDFQ